MVELVAHKFVPRVVVSNELADELAVRHEWNESQGPNSFGFNNRLELLRKIGSVDARNGDGLRIWLIEFPGRVPLYRLTVLVRQTAPANEAHHFGFIVNKNRRTIASQRQHDRIQRSVINLFQCFRAMYSISKQILCFLLASRVPQRMLHQFALSNVPTQSGKPLGLSIWVIKRAPAPEHPSFGTVFAGIAEFQVVIRMILNCGANSFFQVLMIFRMNKLQESRFRLRKLAGFQSEYALEFRRPNHAISFVEIARPGSDLTALHRQAQPFLVLQQSFFRLLQAGDISEVKIHISRANHRCEAD